MRGVTTLTSFRLPPSLVGVVALVAASLSAVAAPAGAGAAGAPGHPGSARQAGPAPSPTSPSWSVQHTPNALVANGSLSADACPSPTWCVAVGSYSDSSGSSPLAEVWNGTAWSVQTVPAPAGASHSVLDAVSCSDPTQCVAVGHYVNRSGALVTLAEVWDGTSWSPTPTPNTPGSTRSALLGVACKSTVCIAVGYSDRSSHQLDLAERWDGTSWIREKVASPVDAIYSILHGVSCLASTACVAVGAYFYGKADLWVTLAESWNGTAWSVQATPNPAGSIVSNLDGVSCSAADACTAVGDAISSAGGLLGATLAEAWNGSSWSIQATPNPAGTTGIDLLQSVSCSSSTVCTAVGHFTSSSVAGASTLAEVWNGEVWTIQGTPDPSGAYSTLYEVSCASAACVAVGFYRNHAGTHVTLAEVSDGTAWTVQPTPIPTGTDPSVLAGVSCASPVSCMAVGSFANSPTTRLTLAEAWDGTAWSVEPTPEARGATHSLLAGVSCSSPTACTAVGQAYNRRSSSALAAVWNGTVWKVQATPAPSGTSPYALLSAVSCASPVACTAVGYYRTGTGLPMTLAEAWNGTDWTIQTTPNPSGNTSSVLDGVSCLSADACTAVGSYTASSGDLVALAEGWDGTDWTIETTPLVDSNLYGVACTSATACTAVGDSYSYPGGVSTLAEAWNGSTWSVQPTPALFSSFAGLYGVSCRSKKACTAAGGYYDSAGVGVTLADDWNGTNWTIAPTPNPKGGSNSVLSSIARRSPGSVVAVGNHLDSAGVVLALAEVERG